MWSGPIGILGTFPSIFEEERIDAYPLRDSKQGSKPVGIVDKSCHLSGDIFIKPLVLIGPSEETFIRCFLFWRIVHNATPHTHALRSSKRRSVRGELRLTLV